MLKDIGPVYAKKLVSKFGEKIFDISEVSPIAWFISRFGHPGPSL